MTGSRRIFAVGWKSRYSRAAGWWEVGSLSIKAERTSRKGTLHLAFVKVIAVFNEIS